MSVASSLPSAITIPAKAECMVCTALPDAVVPLPINVAVIGPTAAARSFSRLAAKYPVGEIRETHGQEPYFAQVKQLTAISDFTACAMKLTKDSLQWAVRCVKLLTAAGNSQESELFTLAVTATCYGSDLVILVSPDVDDFSEESSIMKLVRASASGVPVANVFYTPCLKQVLDVPKINEISPFMFCETDTHNEVHHILDCAIDRYLGKPCV